MLSGDAAAAVSDSAAATAGSQAGSTTETDAGQQRNSDNSSVHALTDSVQPAGILNYSVRAPDGSAASGSGGYFSEYLSDFWRQPEVYAPVLTPFEEANQADGSADDGSGTIALGPGGNQLPPSVESDSAAAAVRISGSDSQPSVSGLSERSAKRMRFEAADSPRILVDSEFNADSALQDRPSGFRQDTRYTVAQVISSAFSDLDTRFSDSSEPKPRPLSESKNEQHHPVTAAAGGTPASTQVSKAASTKPEFDFFGWNPLLLAELNSGLSEETDDRTDADHESAAPESRPDYAQEAQSGEKSDQDDRSGHAGLRTDPAGRDLYAKDDRSDNPPDPPAQFGILRQLRYQSAPRGPPHSERLPASEFTRLTGNAAQLVQLRHCIAPRGPSVSSACADALTDAT